MKIGLYGGSFDPIHSGHIRPVLEAREECGLDRVIYLPTAVPPHKPGRQFASAHARFAMVELALLAEPGLFVSAFELTRDRPAYTIDSVEHFRERFPEAAPHLLIGGDSFAALTTWRRWRDLVEAARLVVLVRPGWEIERTKSELPPELAELVRSDRVIFVGNRPVEVSSTELRQGFARGELPPPGSMPPLVVDYVRKYSLYR